MLIASLWPASSRPYIGGSGDNTVLGLAFGYNGLGRITGNGTGGGPGAGAGGGGGGGGGGFGGSTGIGRLFNSEMGTQIAWLLPAALVGLGALLGWTRRAPRTDRTRAAALLWGGWLLVTGLVLSYASGIIHAYYTVQLAPPIAALVGIGAVELWRRRAEPAARAVLAGGVVLTGVTASVLLARTSDWHPALRWGVLLLAVLAAVGLLVPARVLRRAAMVVPVIGLVAALGSTAAYAAQTASTPHTGSTPAAGPAAASGAAGGGFGPGGAGRGGSGARGTGGGTAGGTAPGGFPGALGAGTGGPGGGLGGPPSATAGGASGTRQSGGGPGGTGATSSALVSLLKGTSATWAAATVGSQSAAPLELASGKAVMTIGGFSGSDDAPTLAQFQQLVAQGKIHYFVRSGGGGAGGPGGAGGGSGNQITSWVEQHFSSTTVGGTTVYDLTKRTS